MALILEVIWVRPGWGGGGRRPGPRRVAWVVICGVICLSNLDTTGPEPRELRPGPRRSGGGGSHLLRYGCISMLRYWSSLRYSFLRMLFLLAGDLRRQPTIWYMGYGCCQGLECGARVWGGGGGEGGGGRG